MTLNTNSLSAANRSLVRVARDAPLLDAAAERALLLAARAGNRAANDRIVLAHLRVVLALTPSFRRAGISDDDLISEGVLGLLEAVKRFDCERENRFATYARWWVRARLRRYVDATRHVVAPPSTRLARKVLQRHGRTVATATQRLGRAVTREDIATALEVSSEELASLEPIFGMLTTSLSSPTDGSCADVPSDLASPEDACADAQHEQQVRQRVACGMSALSARERTILLRRFAFDDEASLADIGLDLRVSRERVRQIQQRACEKFRHRVATATATATATQA